MAITNINDAIPLMQLAMRTIGVDYMDLRLAEIGNQRVKGWRQRTSAAALYGLLGVDYLSLDRNGRDGSVQCDLTEPLTRREWWERYDIVTNFGTSEHVGQAQSLQWQVFANIHYLCRVGGAMVHYVPASGSAQGHGRWKYTCDWFAKVAARNGYLNVLCEQRRKWCKRKCGYDRYVCVVLVKQSSDPFCKLFPPVPRR